jgi:hypothetical protein
MNKLLVTAALLLVVSHAHATVTRDPAQVYAFRSKHPCPANGSKHGTCPNYVVDHLRPLCSGGVDAPANMQWEPLAESLRKDREEDALCRIMVKTGQKDVCTIIRQQPMPLLLKAACKGK